MQKLFKSCYELDKKCYEKYFLSQDILMENAAMGMADYIKKNFKIGSTILIVSGVGNNGADGIVLARQLHKNYSIKLNIPFGVKSPMAKLQLKRAIAIGVSLVDELEDADVIVDAIFGAGLTRNLDNDTQKIVHRLNTLSAFKIACDSPTGVDVNGLLSPIAFRADLTVTMGALVESLFVDESKDYVGEILQVDLGISRSLYENSSKSFVLDKSDLRLPTREFKTSHKGNFGHVTIFCGEKEGAGIIAGSAASRFGAGLTTLVVQDKITLPPYLMHSNEVPKNTTALAIGMGLSKHFDSDFLQKFVVKNKKPILLDADSFYIDELLVIVKQKNRDIVLTPHPKEFSELWRRLTGEELSIDYIQQNRFKVAREFSKKYPQVTLLLKGSNSIIIQDDTLFINPLGSAKLSKGGSGDVLSGLIVSLLAQGYSALEATIQGSLALTACANSYEGASYSMLATDIIQQIGKLE